MCRNNLLAKLREINKCDFRMFCFIFLSRILFLHLLCVLSSFSVIGANSSESRPFSFCNDVKTYRINSTFQANIKFLLSVLSSKATRKVGFYNFTASQDPTNESIVGSFLCRGDVAADECQTCVTKATTEILQLCPIQTRSVVWYDNCLLRYADLSSFSSTEESVRYEKSLKVHYDPNGEFGSDWQKLMNYVVDQAKRNPSGRKNFGSGSSISGIYGLWALGQCLPNLSNASCESCLKEVVTELSSCCDHKVGGRILRWNCNLRYETHPFFTDESNTPSPSPSPSLSFSRPPAPVSVTREANAEKKKRPIGLAGLIVAIVAPIIVFLFLLIMCFCFLRRKSKDQYSEDNDRSEIIGIESLQYLLDTIQAATNNFSDDHKLGEGGFGKVYKGILPNGQEIAVKRLSKSSGQGITEFKNEVRVVAKLQHRNLVRSIGFCMKDEEKILIYEFVPNKSLDYFLFDPQKQELLDWPTRYKIIGGIARAVVYLHEDSRLKVIHRDLKASNILLDKDMNPKLSDFGMARIVGVDQSQANTNRIVGTYGYMSPEYAMFGQFSPKSDMYSFGILILEIISGKRNSSFYDPNNFDNLPGHAFKHWRDGDPSKLVDPSLGNSYDKNEVMKCIHIGLLCVQEDAEDRPTMAAVVSIFNNTTNNSAVLRRIPNQPAFFARSRMDSNIPIEQCSGTLEPFSINETSMTDAYPR